MKRIWIIGAGKFGRRAASLLRQGADKEIIIVDKDSEKLEGLNCATLFQDGVSCLVENLRRDTKDWIVPAVPFQLAYEWVRRKMAVHFSLVPVELNPERQKMLPNCISGGEGQSFVSNADFLCPDNCPEPKGYCTYTGLPRPRIMYRYLTEWGRKHSFDTTVIRSRQLAPGVGGYPARDIFLLLDHLRASQGRERKFLLATACSCHGVINSFELFPQ
jgi:hypothetical protein